MDFLYFFYIFAAVNFTPFIEIDMPYRRLPNTDAARIRAINKALSMSEKSTPEQTPFDGAFRRRMELFVAEFDKNTRHSADARNRQNMNSRKFNELSHKARLYVSHFIQVLNFCIARGEMKPQIREFYGLDIEDSKVPSLQSDADLLYWGEKVINGEQERINKGGNRIYNPTIALVKVNYENYKQAYTFQKGLQGNATRLSGEVASFRQEADDIILELWNSIEAFYAEREPDEERRRALCEEYGIAYVFRRGELKRIADKKEAERITLELPFNQE